MGNRKKRSGLPRKQIVADHRGPTPQSNIPALVPAPTSAKICLGIGLLAILILYVAHCAYFRAYVNDDAYITFRYSRFLSMGRGPYFNVGEHVEGYTNFLLMLLLAPIIGFFGADSAAPFAKCLGVACGGLAILSIALYVWRLDRTNGGSPVRAAMAAILAAGLIAVAPAYALNSMSGLETMLFAGSLSLGLYLGHLSVEQSKWRGAGIAFAAASLTRPEGILLFVIHWFAQLYVARRDAATSFRIRLRPLILDAAIVSSVFAAHIAFRLIAYNGEWLPNTYFAKAGGFWKIAAASYIGRGVLAPFFDHYGIGVGIAVVGWLFSGSTRRKSFPLFCVAALGALLPFVTGTDWMPGWRLLMPFLPAVAGIVAIGWCRIARFIIRRPRELGPGLLLFTIPLLWTLRGDDRTFFYKYVEMRSRGYETGHRSLAQWLRSGAAAKGDTIALMDIGMVGYECIDQNILDVTGLTDRTIAKSLGRFMDKQYDPEYVLHRKPEFIVLVFGANGDPNVPPPKGTILKPWSKNESRIWEHPDFRAHYLRSRPVEAGARRWTEALAAKIGAERIFEHAHPGRYYLLAAFRRTDSTTRPTGS